ncbi:hypothetical protein DFH06DRAFT_88744 [Mycena polygramma]|nr:hypothetical protein DFH06DRAFT_88744 [Mycena polygramma]
MQSSTATPSQPPDDTSSVSTPLPASTLAHSRPSVTLTHPFLGKLKLRAGPAGKQHINKSVDSAGDLVGYSEFRGRGPPPPDVGQVGDVYWDTTGSVFYARYAGIGDDGPCPSTDACSASASPAVGSDGSGEQWRAWRDDPSNPQPLVKHPLYDDRFLWFGGKSGRGLGWFASQCLNGRYVDLRSASLSDTDKEHLANLLDPSAPSPRRTGSKNAAAQANARQSGTPSKRKRQEPDSDSEDSPRSKMRWEGPEAFTQIPATMKGMLAQVVQLGSELIKTAQSGQETLVPMADKLVLEEFNLLTAAGGQVMELRAERNKLEAELTTKEAEIKNDQELIRKATCQIIRLQTDVDKAKDSETVIQNELEAEKQRSNTKDAEIQRLQTELLKVGQQLEISEAKTRELIEDKKNEYQSVFAGFMAIVQTGAEGVTAHLNQN